MSLAMMCGIPGCREVIFDEQVGLCEQHYRDGYYPDYQRYRDLLAEGYPTYQAAVMSGLKDPDD